MVDDCLADSDGTAAMLMYIDYGIFGKLSNYL